MASIHVAMGPEHGRNPLLTQVLVISHTVIISMKYHSNQSAADRLRTEHQEH